MSMSNTCLATIYSILFFSFVLFGTFDFNIASICMELSSGPLFCCFKKLHFVLLTFNCYSFHLPAFLWSSVIMNTLPLFEPISILLAFFMGFLEKFCFECLKMPYLFLLIAIFWKFSVH